MRVALTVRSHRVAIVDGGFEAEVFVGAKQNAHSGCRERVGRSAAWKISSKQSGPTPSPIEKVSADTDQEVAISGELTDPSTVRRSLNSLAEAKARTNRVGGLQIAYRHQTVESAVMLRP